MPEARIEGVITCWLAGQEQTVLVNVRWFPALAMHLRVKSSHHRDMDKANALKFLIASSRRTFRYDIRQGALADIQESALPRNARYGISTTTNPNGATSSMACATRSVAARMRGQLVVVKTMTLIRRVARFC